MSWLDTTLRGRRGIRVSVVAALTVIVLGLANYELRDTGQPHGQAEPHKVASTASMTFDHKPTLLVVGDAYAATYPDLVADKMGWSLVGDIRDGTGFVEGGDANPSGGAPFVARLAGDAAAYHVDYVLIDGGRDDLVLPPERVVAAADEYLGKVHSEWPKAKIILILPNYATSTPNDNYPAVALGLRSSAERVGAYVIDPVAQRWYSDVDAKGLVWREAHLNSAGDSYYGDRVVENLKQMFDPKPVLLVAGDSFAAGVGDPNNPTYPYLVANRMGWNLALDAQGGTGFASGIDSLSPPTVPFIDRLDRDAATYAYHVDYVLIDGGRVDLDLPPERVVAAADEYVKKVRSDWPKARIIVVLPSFPTPVAAESYSAVAQGLRSAAESVGADLIDPTAQHWYRGIEGKTLMWRDGAHLNAKGETYYADKVIDNLKRMGLAS
jgi:hypothetical protein